MIQVRVQTDEVRVLSDPARMARAEARIIERGVEVFQPLARDEAPRRTGRGRGMIVGVVDRRSGRPTGRVHPGKAFYLRILATGAKWKEDIVPFRYALNRRGSRRSTTLAQSALGPGRMRGATRALRFRLGGAYLFRSRVEHPDLPSNAWLERAARKGESPYVQAAEAVLTAELGGRRG